MEGLPCWCELLVYWLKKNAGTQRNNPTRLKYKMFIQVSFIKYSKTENLDISTDIAMCLYMCVGLHFAYTKGGETF